MQHAEMMELRTHLQLEILILELTCLIILTTLDLHHLLVKLAHGDVDRDADRRARH